MTSARDAAWEALNKAALSGARCPTAGTFGLSRAGVKQLLKEEKIRVEVYSRNWRVVTILDGDNKGRSTLRSPCGGKPYRVLEGASDTLANAGRHGRQSSRRPITLAPSEPRKPR